MRKSDTMKSRKKTPWDGVDDVTATQAFLKENYELRYGNHHRKVAESGESEMVNSYVPVNCPFCASVDFKRNGHTDSGVQRYKCTCQKTFLPTTGTIFDDHKLSIGEWTEYCLNLFRHVSITADSWSNKNTFNTSRYWLQKLFLTLEGVQDGIVLRDTIWLDETYYRVRSEDVERDESGGKLKGISKNQLRIAVATDGQYTVFIYEGTGKPSQKRTFETFGNRITPHATLIHDKENAHQRLVAKLGLKSISYASKDLRGVLDKDNPLYPVNRAHAILKMFLNAHSGFKREHLQGYLNLFALVTNPPHDMLEKVEIVVNSAFATPKTLRYRDFFGLNTVF